MDEHERTGNWWTLVSDSAAVYWRSEWIEGDDLDGEYGPDFGFSDVTMDGMVIYGDVTSKSLRQIHFRQLSPWMDPWISGDEPPTADQIREAWGYDEYPRASPGTVVPALPRRDPAVESADDFYLRVAEFYEVRYADSGTPTRDIAEAAGVPWSTAARWVREARKRRLLRRTSQGRAGI